VTRAQRNYSHPSALWDRFFVGAVCLLAVSLVPMIIYVARHNSPQATGTTPSQTAFLDHETDVIWSFLGSNCERKAYRTSQDGQKSVVHITKSQVHEVVLAAWQAAPLNPGWGSRRTTTIKLVSAAYRETRFVFDAVHVNKNGTIDIGLMQINSCNWFSGKGCKKWKRFCKSQKLKPKNIGALMDPYISMGYAAYLNQTFIKNHCHQYVFYGYRSQRKLYDLMLKAEKGD